LLVSERALGADQGGKYLLVVNAENVVEKRPVTTGQTIDGMLVIEEGVRADDWVVVNGIQKARPGGEVEPERSDMAGLSTSARESAAAGDGQTSAPGADSEAPADGEPAVEKSAEQAPDEQPEAAEPVAESESSKKPRP
jgi:hypothetical protein